jgi:dTMP kinase
MAFITFEGIEGSGKSTQAERLAARLAPAALLTRQPGGTALGQKIREVLLDPGNGALVPEAELLLYFADRAQNVGEVIRPALEAGRTVIGDRYNDSTVAYQGYGRGLSLEGIERLAAVATGGLVPDLTLWIDVPVALGLSRVGKRGRSDRLESESVTFHERVRAGYEALAAGCAGRFVRIDGVGTADEVGERVDAAVAARGFNGVPALR